MPLILIFLDIAFLQSGASSSSAPAFVVAVVLNWTLIACDMANLKRAGYRLDGGLWWGAALLVPLYLIRRTLMTRHNWVPAIAWAVSMLLYFVSTPVVGALGGVEMDGPYVENWIETSYAESYGQEIDVRCPHDPIAPVGSLFECDVVGSDGSAGTVQVTVETWDGVFSWQIYQ
ncbi:DUF4333 domain-containing protein [Puerhibacterium sp. TATVAM-FAB25]|uniref:DUF4333 domain-containing protein n=1 Tax=Puerhibacterium sp. TATVAM-FAB25 TaxID=3093699 RepID=UPI003978F3FE